MSERERMSDQGMTYEEYVRRYGENLQTSHEPSVKDDVAAVRLAMGYAAKGTVSSGGSVRPNGLAAFDRILRQLQEAEERAAWCEASHPSEPSVKDEQRILLDFIAEPVGWSNGNTSEQQDAALAALRRLRHQLQEAEERAADWKTKAWANNYTREASDRALTEVMAQLAESEKERELLRELLRRLRAWDIMDVTGDGPYWKREIDQALSPDSQEKRAE